jgi:phosphatidylglycerol:prolipoprotein diacylglycerol transferase
VERFLQRNAPEVVPFTVAIDSRRLAVPGAVLLEVRGKRCGGRAQGGCDRFRHIVTIDNVDPAGGPVVVTGKVEGFPSGDWRLSASASSADTARRALPAAAVRWSWQRWRLVPESSATVSSTLAPFVSTPAVLLGSWLAFVVAGIISAIVLQSVAIAEASLRVPRLRLITGLSLIVGVIGAKIWFAVLNRRERRREGWAVQGLVAGIALSAPLFILAFHSNFEGFLDGTAPGLMVGLGIGRIGCFLTGCCAGRPTCSRWGVFSSNRWIGRRRVPVQLIESAVALAVGVGAYLALLDTGTQHGGILLGSLASYTVIRQVALSMREEPRQSRLGSMTVAGVASAMLIADAAVLALH